ncbi:hypothetical protein ACTFIW_005769 [Dictyostelium discoideum]
MEKPDFEKIYIGELKDQNNDSTQTPSKPKKPNNQNSDMDASQSSLDPKIRNFISKNGKNHQLKTMKMLALGVLGLQLLLNLGHPNGNEMISRNVLFMSKIGESKIISTGNTTKLPNPKNVLQLLIVNNNDFPPERATTTTTTTTTTTANQQQQTNDEDDALLLNVFSNSSFIVDT